MDWKPLMGRIVSRAPSRNSAEDLQKAVNTQEAKNKELQEVLARKQEEARIKEQLKEAKKKEASIYEALASYGTRHISWRKVIMLIVLILVMFLMFKTCSGSCGVAPSSNTTPNTQPPVVTTK